MSDTGTGTTSSFQSMVLPPGQTPGHSAHRCDHSGSPSIPAPMEIPEPVNFAFSEEQEELQRRAGSSNRRRLLSGPTHAGTEDGFDQALWLENAAMGWQAMAIPERYGAPVSVSSSWSYCSRRWGGRHPLPSSRR